MNLGKLDLSAFKSVDKLLRPLKPIVRHHYFITTLGILICLIVAVYLVNQTLQEPSDEAYRTEKMSTGINARFDEATIEQVELLQRSSDSPSGVEPLPSGARTNPFAE